MSSRIAPLMLVALLAACQAGIREPAVGRAEAVQPPLATVPSDACWATDRVLAVVETVYEPNGENGARQPREIVQHPAEERLFAVPCPDQMPEGFTASLQRALAARGLFTGPVSGRYDAATGAAVRRFQTPQGLNSAILSLQGAQQLGLVALPRAAY